MVKYLKVEAQLFQIGKGGVAVKWMDLTGTSSVGRISEADALKTLEKLV